MFDDSDGLIGVGGPMSFPSIDHAWDNHHRWINLRQNQLQNVRNLAGVLLPYGVPYTRHDSTGLTCLGSTAYDRAWLRMVAISRIQVIPFKFLICA